jgi:glyoxylase-like metal-dependent hydrolase (beta-lactamase superfamily II)
MSASPYTGHVEPSSAPIRRSVRHLDTTVEITKVSVGPMDNNCYVLRDASTDRAMVIDAAAEPDRVLDTIGDAAVDLVLTTHGHRDHWQALQPVSSATGATVAHHAGDAGQIPVPPDLTVEHGQTLRFGQATVMVRHTPGHTDGSVCVVLIGQAVDRPSTTTHVFTGDTLFPGGPGRTTTSPQFERIMRSLRERLFDLPDETWIYPGHGDDTTLGTERPHLDEWQQRGW